MIFNLEKNLFGTCLFVDILQNENHRFERFEKIFIPNIHDNALFTLNG